ncbi:MAG TPA: AI-2E family transporter, partial [Ktedonobacteraceae bacterium]|nr:AI-2E family transporter [Ktedonobacteraceae bacterium]
KGLPTSVAMLILVVILLVAFLLFILILSISLNQLQQRLPVYESMLTQRTNELTATLAQFGINIRGSLNTNIVNGTTLAKAAINAITGILSNAAGIIFFLFLLFLMLAESGSIARRLGESYDAGQAFSRQFTTYSQQIQKQYRIQALSNLLSAGAIMIELLLFRVDFAILWGFLAFVLGFIPNIGLILATLPAVLIALLLYGPGTALAITAIAIVLNAAMDNVVTPRFMGTGLNLPMLLIFFSFLFWTWIFGFLGALLAVPATLLLRTILQNQSEARLLVILLSRDEEERASREPEVAP